MSIEESAGTAIPASPVFDLTGLSAVQTLFSPADGLTDPWAVTLAGSFADLFIYSDQVRAIIPATSLSGSDVRSIGQPNIIHDFLQGDDAFIKPVTYLTSELRDLNEQNLESAYRTFDRWARRYRNHLRLFCKLHQTEYVDVHQRSRIANRFTFNIGSYLTDPRVSILAHDIQISQEMLLYCFDLSLRMPLYGELAGAGNHYLNHPLRDSFSIIGSTETRVAPPNVPITFAATISNIAHRLDRETYVTTLKVLRDKVREFGLVGAAPGDFEPDLVREIAAAAKLPPRLRAESTIGAVLKTV